MRQHALVWAILASVVASASSDAESDYWKKWQSEHGNEMFGGPWHFMEVKVVPDGPAVVGQPVTVRAKAWFWPEHAPPARVKARVFWHANPGTELLSDAMVETYVGPKDTLDARAVIRGDGGISACARVYLYYVVGGVPVKGVRPVWVHDPSAWDHWAFAGWGCGDFGPNPLNPRELLDQDQLDLIHQNIQQAFKDRLAGARVGVVRASAEAQAVIDSLLPTVDEPTRHQLGVACDYMAARTKTGPGEAARFVGKQILVWARGQEYAWMGGSEQAVAEWAVGAAERGMLEDMYKSTVVPVKQEPDDPMFRMYKPLFEAKDGKITWDEAKERVDSLIAAYPDDALGPFIRDVELPRWRKRYTRTWLEKFLDAVLKGEAHVTEEPEEERYTWFFQGYWKYHDHAVTRYDGLASETTDEPVRRGWAYIQFISGGDVVLRGPFVLGEDGYFQFGPEDFPDAQLSVTPFVVLYGQFPTYQWPQLYVMETDSSPAYRVYSPPQTVYPGNANLGACFPNPAHPVRDEVLNIFDRLVEAWQRIPTTPPPQSVTLQATWRAGKAARTRYAQATRRIYLNGAGESSAEWSDDTIFHEFGHFAFDTYGTDVSPGGAHFWREAYPNRPALALSEGWAHCYQCYVNHEIGVPAWHEGYCLTPLGGLGGTQTAWAEIENPWHFGTGVVPDSGLQCGLYNEASVAGCLWDMFDAANEAYETACSQHADCYADVLSGPITEIWNAVMTGVPVTLLDVLETWYGNGYGHQAQICEICNHHGIPRWLWMSPEYVSTNAIVSDTIPFPLTLRNTDGGAAHSYSVTTDVAWAWPDVGTGSIDPGDSVDLQLWLDGVGWPLDETRQGVVTVSDGSGGCGLQVPLRVIGTNFGLEIVAGRVADADGWVEGATAGTDPAGATAVTDEEGWFALAMAQGVYALRVWAAGHYPVMLPGVTCPSDVGTVFLTTHGTPEGSSLVCAFQGSASTFQGRALLAGDVVEAWDPDGVLCGAWEVATEGCYGPMTVYGDDATTPGVDEGAEEGDTLRFTINGFTAVCLGPDDPVWHAGGGPYRVELTAHDAPPKPVIDLAVAVVDSLALLQWTAVTEDTSGDPEPSIRAFIHRSPVAYFEPGEGTEIDWIFGESEYWDWESGLGEPNAHSFYRLVIRDNLGQESTPSNTVGEFEFGTGGVLLKSDTSVMPSRLE